MTLLSSYLGNLFSPSQNQSLNLSYLRELYTSNSNSTCWTVVAIVIPLVTVLLWTFKKSSTPNPRDANRNLEETSVIRKALPEAGTIKVSKIFIHPIKSCKGLSVESVDYTCEGVQNDRMWCIIDATKRTVITARDVAKMVLITPTIEADGTLKVSFPDGSGCDSFNILVDPDENTLEAWESIPNLELWSTPIDGYVCEAIYGPKGSASAILSKYFERPVHLLFKGPRPRIAKPTTRFPNLKSTSKYQDMYPMLILSEESVESIAKRIREYAQSGTISGIDEKWKSENVVIERFRPNVVLQGAGPFSEDDWEEISIGDSVRAPRITLVSHCTRCLLPNVDPVNGERDKAVPYKALMKFRTGLDPTHKMSPCVGCNAVPSGSGTLRVGDSVYVEKMI